MRGQAPLFLGIKMIIVKKEINNNTDGSTELFELGSIPIEGSVVAIEMGNQLTIPSVAELGGNFIQVTPAPSSPLLIFYENNSNELIDSSSIVSGLSPWDSRRIVNMMEIISNIQQTLEVIDKSLKNRLSKEEFNSWAAVMQEQIREVKSQL